MGCFVSPSKQPVEGGGRSNPPVTFRCSSLLLSVAVSADVRSADDVIAFPGLPGWNQLQPWTDAWSRSSKTAGGQMSNADSFAQNPQRILTVGSPGSGDAPGGAATVHFLLTRQSVGKGKGYATAVHLLHLKHRLVGPVNKRLVVGAASYTDQREHVRTEQLVPGSYLLVPSMMNRGTEADFTLTVIADAAVTLSNPRKPPRRSRGNSLSGTPTSPSPGAGPEHTGLVPSSPVANIASQETFLTSAAEPPKVLFVGNAPEQQRVGKRLQRKGKAVLPPIHPASTYLAFTCYV